MGEVTSVLWFVSAELSVVLIFLGVGLQSGRRLEVTGRGHYVGESRTAGGDQGPVWGEAEK